MDVSVVIPTYRREQVLVDTVSALLALAQPPDEMLVVDETEQHEPETLRYLQQAEADGRIRWRRHRQPGQISKLNRGLRESRGDIVLFLDDDILPSPALVEMHRQAHARHPEAWAVVGQVLQPGEEPSASAPHRNGRSALRRDLDFPFHGSAPAWVENVITCNLSVRRERALAAGGFDENFVPPVAHRAETEFAKRLVAAGGRIRFEPSASVRHLRAVSGGTRSRGGHLASASPIHGVGDYYYALRCGYGWERAWYILRRPFREVRTKFHLIHPWWILPKFIGELRAIRLAFCLNREGPRLIAGHVRSHGNPGGGNPQAMGKFRAKIFRLFAVETHPIQYKAPLFRRLAADPRIDLTVLYAMIPDAAQQGAGFGVPFAWDVPLLEGYRHEVLENRSAQPSVTTFSGCDTPGLFERLRRDKPDAVLVNGWGTKTSLQALWACRRLGIPCLVRGEANRLRPRAAWKHGLHRLLMRQYSAFLAIGSANRDFYRCHRCREDRIFWAPYAVDNESFAAQAAARAGRRDEVRAAFGIPPAATVFLFAGKLEEKKHPQDLLEAVSRLPAELRAQAHVLIAGDGPQRAACERMARERNLPVSFAGFLNQSRLPDAYAAADVLVLPSDAGETWGLVVNEAMASGRPAVVSRAAGCCADLIVEEKTGHAFASRDVHKLADVLAGYLRAPGLAARQGVAAAEQIRSFDFGMAAAGIAAAVTACAGGRRPC